MASKKNSKSSKDEEDIHIPLDIAKVINALGDSHLQMNTLSVYQDPKGIWRFPKWCKTDEYKAFCMKIFSENATETQLHEMACQMTTNNCKEEQEAEEMASNKNSSKNIPLRLCNVINALGDRCLQMDTLSVYQDPQGIWTFPQWCKTDEYKAFCMKIFSENGTETQLLEMTCQV